MKKKPSYWVSAEVKPWWDWDPRDAESYPYGFTTRNKPTVKKIRVGDYILRYWTKHGFIGVIEVTEPYYPGKGPFPCKVKCKCSAALPEGAAIPLNNVVRRLTFYEQVRKSPRALGNFVRRSPTLWEEPDGRIIERTIREAEADSTHRPKSSSHRAPSRTAKTSRKRLDRVEDVVEEHVRQLSKAAGFEQNPRIRRAVESHAMETVRQYYEKQGFTVEPKGKPYDFECKSLKEHLYVEVKGTKNLGEAITLTKNEVEFAKKHARNMVLCVVHSIKVSGKRYPTATGGKFEQIENWSPDSRRLEPIAFRYRR